jgi:hypothetical protein
LPPPAATAADPLFGRDCQQQSGASGGPSILVFRPTLTALSYNYAGGVNSYVNTQASQIYSAYFDQAHWDPKDQSVAASPGGRSGR